jgi:hypothetical protein
MKVDTTTKARLLAKMAQGVSLLALAATIAPAVLFLLGRMDLGQVHSTMLWATVAWFVSAAGWMER